MKRALGKFSRTKSTTDMYGSSPEVSSSPKRITAIASTLRRKQTQSNEMSKFITQISDGTSSGDSNSALNAIKYIDSQCESDPTNLHLLVDKSTVKTIIESMNKFVTNQEIRVNGMTIFTRMFKNVETRKKAVELFCDKDILNSIHELFISHQSDDGVYLGIIECLAEFTNESERSVKKIHGTKDFFTKIIHNTTVFRESKEIVNGSIRTIYNLICDNKKYQESFLKSDDFCNILSLFKEPKDPQNENDFKDLANEYEICRVFSNMAMNFNLLKSDFKGRENIIKIVNELGEVKKEQFAIQYCTTLLSFTEKSDGNYFEGFSGIRYSTIITVMSSFYGSEEIQEKCMALLAILCKGRPDFPKFFFKKDNLKCVCKTLLSITDNKKMLSSFETIMNKFNETPIYVTTVPDVVDILDELTHLPRSPILEKVFEHFVDEFSLEDNREYIMRDGFFEILFNILAKYDTMEKVSKNILTMVLYILDENIKNNKPIKEIKCFMLVISNVMKTHIKNEAIQKIVFNIIYSLKKNNDYMRQIYSSEVTERIAETLKDHEKNELVQEHGLRVLSMLSVNDFTREKVDTSKVISRVVKALKSYIMNEVIREASCIIYTQIVNSIKIVVEKKGVKDILDIMCFTKVTDKFILLALDAFMNISRCVEKKDLPMGSCASPVVTKFMNKKMNDEEIVSKCFAFLSIIMTLKQNDIDQIIMTSISQGVMAVIINCTENIRNKKTTLEACEAVSENIFGICKNSFSFSEEYVPIIKFLGNESVKPQVKRFCCSMLAQVNPTTINKESVNEIIDCMKLITEKNQSDTGLIDDCCKLLEVIGSLDRDDVKEALVESDIHINLLNIINKQEVKSRQIITTLKVFVRLNTSMNSTIWLKVSSTLLRLISNEGKSDKDIFNRCFDFMQESLKYHLKCVSVEQISFLMNIALKEDEDNSVWDACKLLLLLLRIKSIEGEGFSKETCTMIEDVTNENKQLSQLNIILAELNSFEQVNGKSIFLDVIFIIMFYHINNAKIEKLGLDILCKNVGDDKRMKNLHMIEFVVSIMKRYPENDEILASAMNSLKRLVSFLKYGKDVAINTIKTAKRIARDTKVLKEIEDIEIQKANAGDCSLPFKFSEEIFCTERFVLVEKIKQLKELKTEDLLKFLEQLGVLDPKNIVQNQICGEALCNANSVEDMASLCGISNEDAGKIIKFINILKVRGNKNKTVQEDFCKESEESPVIDSYKEIPPDFYETLEKSLKTADFRNIKSLMKDSVEIAKYLERQGLLEGDGEKEITQADAMAITIYTYDNGKEHFEENPYRIINKALNEKDMEKAKVLKGYILRLLSALRKLPAYNETSVLYRGVTNVNKDLYKVGSKLTWPAFTSTSSDEDSVVDFFNNIAVEGDKFIFEITGCFNKGHSIRNFSFHLDEDEILFEPETKFKVIEVKPDPKVKDATRICVEILDTPPALDEAAKNFLKKCEENIDFENNNEQASDENIPSYKGPIVSKEKWHDLWDDLKKHYTGYMGLKGTLSYMEEKDLREMLVDGYKTAAIDDEYGEGAGMMKGFKLSVEEGASLYSCTYKYGEKEVEKGENGKNSPYDALNEMMKLWDGGEMDLHWANYLLHIASSLEKLPVWGKKSDAEDDESGSVDEKSSKQEKKIYFCVKKEEADKLEAGKEYVIGSIFVGCTEKYNAPEGECIVCIEDAQNLCVREIGPLSAWGKTGYVLGLPGARFTVISSDGNVIAAKALSMNEEESKKYEDCIKKFAQSAPLPEGWSAEIDDESGRIFYQNNDTDDAQWTRPTIEDPEFFTDFTPKDTLIEINNSDKPLPQNWTTQVDPNSGSTLYVNLVTGKTQRDFPQDDQGTTANSVQQDNINSNAQHSWTPSSKNHMTIQHNPQQYQFLQNTGTNLIQQQGFYNSRSQGMPSPGSSQSPRNSPISPPQSVAHPPQQYSPTNACSPNSSPTQQQATFSAFMHGHNKGMTTSSSPRNIHSGDEQQTQFSSSSSSPQNRLAAPQRFQHKHQLSQSVIMNSSHAQSTYDPRHQDMSSPNTFQSPRYSPNSSPQINQMPQPFSPGCAPQAYPKTGRSYSLFSSPMQQFVPSSGPACSNGLGMSTNTVTQEIHDGSDYQSHNSSSSSLSSSQSQSSHGLKSQRGSHGLKLSQGLSMSLAQQQQEEQQQQQYQQQQNLRGPNTRNNLSMSTSSLPQNVHSGSDVGSSQGNQFARSLPPNWIAKVDPKSGRTYYANTLTKKTQWNFPQEMVHSKSQLSFNRVEPQTIPGNAQQAQSFSPQNNLTFLQKTRHYNILSQSTPMSPMQQQQQQQSPRFHDESSLLYLDGPSDLQAIDEITSPNNDNYPDPNIGAAQIASPYSVANVPRFDIFQPFSPQSMVPTNDPLSSQSQLQRADNNASAQASYDNPYSILSTDFTANSQPNISSPQSMYFSQNVEVISDPMQALNIGSVSPQTNPQNAPNNPITPKYI